VTRLEREPEPVPPAEPLTPEVGADLEATAESLGRRHVRGSSLLLVGRIASLVFTTATQIIIVRATTKADYGAFALALVIASASRTMLSLGQGKTLSRFLAIHVEHKDWGRLYGTVFIAVGTVVLTGSLLIGTLFGLRDQLVGTILDDRTAAAVLLIIVLLAPMEALDQIFVSVFAVLTRPRAIFFRKYLLAPGLRFVVVLTVALVDGSIVALAIGYVAAEVLGLILYVTVLRSVLNRNGLLGELRWRRLSWPVRSVLGFAVPMLSTELVYLSMNTGSVLLLSHLWDAAEVADLRAVIPAVTLNKIVYATFLTLYLPMASRLFARGDHENLRSDYWRTAAFLAVASFPIFAMTGPFADATTVTLFGERYAGSAVFLAILSTGYYLNSALGFNMVTLQAYGKVRYLLAVNVVCALGNLALSLLLVPDLGALGVAVSNCVTLLAQNALNQLGLCRVTGSPPIERGYRWTYTSIALVSLVLFGAGLLLPRGLLAALAITAVATLLLVVVNRRVLALLDSFPELGKVPVLRRIVSVPRGR